jgi:DNA-binding transcriptional ArsR family regulator
VSGDPAAPVFAALSDPTRRDVVRRLAGGSATATELAAGLPITRQAVAKHLAALEDAGLVRAERQGREVRYLLTPEPLGAAVSWIEDLDTTWADRLTALRDHLSAPG